MNITQHVIQARAAIAHAEGALSVLTGPAPVVLVDGRAA
jgi:hypothetical protein